MQRRCIPSHIVLYISNKGGSCAGASLLQSGVEGGSLDIVKLLLSELHASGPLKDCSGQQSSAGIVHGTAEASLGQEGYAASTQQSEAEYDPEQAHHLECGDSSAPQGSQDSLREHVQRARVRLSDRKAASVSVCNPVHVAALKGFSDLLPSLLGAGFSASAPDAYKRTPLHYAAMKGFAFFPAHHSGTQMPAPEPSSRPDSGEQHSAQHSQGQGDVKPEGASNQQQVVGSQAHAEGCLTPGCTPSCSGDSEHSYASPGSSAPSAMPIVAPAGTCVAPGGPPPFAQPHAGTGSMSYGSSSMPGVGTPHPYSAGLPAPTQYYGPRATVAYGLTADLLLEAGADADAIDMWGCSALHYAAGACQLLMGNGGWYGACVKGFLHDH